MSKNLTVLISLPNLETFYITANKLRFHVTAWGDKRQPPVVMHAGTGFVAATWHPVAEALSQQFRVYAIDRRGHGWSEKPESGYEFFDFAEDTVAILDALELQPVIAIGHSAGGTDFLTAASLKPDLFKAIFLHEPTMADTTIHPKVANLPSWAVDQIERVNNRRAHFPSREDAFKHFRSREPFSHWQEMLLGLHIHFGLEAQAEGDLRLSCYPAIETQILMPIYSAMNNIHTGDHRGSPFNHFKDIQQPVGLVRSENSGERFIAMFERVETTLPNAIIMPPLQNTGHCAPQENPQALLDAIQTFLSMPI